MANYKETQISGTSWIRAHEVVVRNPHEGMPSIYFQEEEVINVGNKSIRQPANNMQLPPLVETFADPHHSFRFDTPRD